MTAARPEPAPVGPWNRRLNQDTPPELHRPESERALLALLDGEPDWLPIHHGASGSRTPPAPPRWLALDALPRAIHIDSASQTARVTGPVSWNELEAAAAPLGFTALHWAGVSPERGVLSTLARPPLLPSLWLTPTPHAACTGLRGVDWSGEPYRAIAAPRTASGPDFRALFLGREGREGVLLEAELVLERRAPAVGWHLPDPLLDNTLQQALRAAPHRLRLLAGPNGVGWTLVLRGAGDEVRHLQDALVHTLGDPADDPAPGPGLVRGDRCWVLTAPWSLARRIPAIEGARPLAATGTHAAFAIPPDTRPAGKNGPAAPSIQLPAAQAHHLRLVAHGTAAPPTAATALLLESTVAGATP